MNTLLKSIVSTAFPDYRGRKVSVNPTDQVLFAGLNWDGGYRSRFHAVGLDPSGRLVTAPMFAGDHAPAPWNNPLEGKRIQLPPDTCIVELCDAACKQYAIVHVNPARASLLQDRPTLS